MVWPNLQEARVACTWCDAWFGGRCKRARKEKKNLAQRHCRSDRDWDNSMCEREAEDRQKWRKIVTSSKCPKQPTKAAGMTTHSELYNTHQPLVPGVDDGL